MGIHFYGCSTCRWSYLWLLYSRLFSSSDMYCRYWIFCMRMNTLINKFKIIRYFIKNGIFNEERAIEISKFDHNTIEALVHSQLLVQVDGRVYLDKPLYDFRYKEKYIYYGEIILLIILLIFASYVSYLKTTLFWRQ